MVFMLILLKFPSSVTQGLSALAPVASGAGCVPVGGLSHATQNVHQHPGLDLLDARRQMPPRGTVTTKTPPDIAAHLLGPGHPHTALGWKSSRDNV